MYICMHVCVYACMYMYVCIHVCMYTCMYVYIYMYTYMYVHMYIFMYTCRHVYIYVCMYVYMRVCTCMYVYMYVCIYVCMYIYTCIHICMYIWIRQIKNGWMKFHEVWYCRILQKIAWPFQCLFRSDNILTTRLLFCNAQVFACCKLSSYRTQLTAAAAICATLLSGSGDLWRSEHVLRTTHIPKSDVQI
jgi:hypothetical protein